ncbi:arylsulfatase [Lutibacter citreus]|uniref:arylsulfatase n=1 Tax=Lutibacter citreus TaxID=2138210 RepID=UPI000DBE4DE2|nr:arylsulfatase [Lutibacter citreus]
MNKFLLMLLGLLLAVSCGKAKKQEEAIKQEVKQPNIIYILADDLGYGDLSCYGQQKIKTPNIDALATRGMKFTQHYTGSAVCAPSRSSLMTGEHTGHTPIRGNKELNEEGQIPLPAESVTIAEVLKTAGYKTGAFGKWGLGFNEGDPNNQGFDVFYGYNCQRMAHRYYPPHLWENQNKVLLEGNDWINTVTYAPDKIQEATLKFIEENKATPFFAYVPLVLPHAELISPNDSIFNKYKGKFEETPLTSDASYTSDYGPDIIPKEYCSQEMPHAAFASMIDRLDVYVGQIVDKVNELGIADNTIIMFASDNGPHAEGGADPEFFNSAGGLKGIKRDLYEGGIRTPFVVVWPGKVKEGSTSNFVSAFWDIMPTIADITKVEGAKDIDGISLLPTLLGENTQKQHDYLYWEFSIQNGRKAIRKDNWKGVWYNIKAKKPGEFELYDLSKDISENNNLAKNHPEIVKELKQLMVDASEPSELFPF